ncbi:hypothetical protein GCM10008955_15720 [Deinococcus malanensis]|uniref:Uncharacterized protein n=1 Tax=Deinococcus malanensis TaxID=1706855 RepID=A0ABQ2ERL0_9DEIO|nr:hypothetical protein GCM10008955_15720 [Deinococcus malanensis]
MVRAASMEVRRDKGGLLMSCTLAGGALSGVRAPVSFGSADEFFILWSRGGGYTSGQ